MPRRTDEALREAFSRAVHGEGAAHGIPSARATDLLAHFDEAFPADPTRSISDGRPSILDLAAVFWQAAGVLEPEPLFSFFESAPSADLIHLVDRVAAASYLATPSTPLLDLEELAHQATQTLEFLRAHEKEFLRHGEVTVLPSDFRWLALRMCSFHHHQRGLRFAEVEHDKRGRSWIIYDAPEASESAADAAMSRSLDALRQTVPASRMRAAPGEPEISTSWSHLIAPSGLADRRSAARNAAVHAARKRVLKTLIDCVVAREPKRLWSRVVDELGKHFDQAEVESMLHECMLWGSVDREPGGFAIEEMILELGPLIGLLEVVGHFEKELEIGSLSKTRARLSPVLGSFASAPDRSRFPSYFQLLNGPVIEPVNEALDLYLDLERAERGFWASFQSRLVLDLQTDFPVRIEVPSIRVRARFVRDATEMLQELTREVARRMEEHGRELDRPLRSPIAIGENRFIRDGGDWLVEFEGVVVRVKASKNLARIARLLEKPRGDVPSIDLARMDEDGRIRVEEPDEVTDDPDDPDEGPPMDGGQALDHFEPEEIARLRGQRAALAREIEEARRDHDVSRVERLQAEVAALSDYIIGGLTKDGAGRKEGSWVEKARKSAGNSIGRGIEAIRKVHPSLAIHLHRYIDKGVTCVYRPDPPCAWRIEFEHKP